ncbi:MAG: hypothetical protein WA063_02260 [Minisyncoccia bacterium]
MRNLPVAGGEYTSSASVENNVVSANAPGVFGKNTAVASGNVSLPD